MSNDKYLIQLTNMIQHCHHPLMNPNVISHKEYCVKAIATYSTENHKLFLKKSMTNQMSPLKTDIASTYATTERHSLISESPFANYNSYFHQCNHRYGNIALSKPYWTIIHVIAYQQFRLPPTTLQTHFSDRDITIRKTFNC